MTEVVGTRPASSVPLAAPVAGAKVLGTLPGGGTRNFPVGGPGGLATNGSDGMPLAQRIAIVEQSQAAGIIGVATLADRPAPSSATIGRLVRVTNDPDPDNNGTYRDTGSAWVKAADMTTLLAAEVRTKADKAEVAAVVQYIADDDYTMPVGVSKVVADDSAAAATVFDDNGVPNFPGREMVFADDLTMPLDARGGYVDEDGRLALGVDGAGNILQPGGAPVTADFRVSAVDGRLQVFDGTTQLTDSDAGDNFAPYAIDTGTFLFSSTRSGQLETYRQRRSDPQPLPADSGRLELMILDGQSLSVGYSDGTGGPYSLISPNALLPEHALMFPNGSKGVRGSEWSAIVSGGLSTVVPLKEQGSGQSRDTHATGMSQWVYAGERNHVPRIYACHGAGGASYAEIKKGGVYDAGSAGPVGEPTHVYDRMLEQVGALVDIAGRYGLSPRVDVITLTHGEDDSWRASGVYYGYLVEHYSNYVADIAALTGQAEPPLIAVDQLGNRATSAVPLDQLRFCDETSGAYMPCPKYHLSWLHTDGTWSHLTPTGYTLMGEYHGIARAHYAEHGEFQPLRPISAVRSGTTVRVRFNVGPGLRLVADTTSLPEQVGAGARFRTDAGETAISSYALEGTDTLLLELSAAPSGANERVTFGERSAAHSNGYSYPIINLRDDSPRMSKRVPTEHLYNWCVISEIYL